ncbi:hypothetical protein RIF29_40360 [Crotalaria pallida]|uniref:Uncharacterized protein n=1 Tax=Crotalaria pallida TaxID=3830 RepID=A0AAN9E3E0_CROPI
MEITTSANSSNLTPLVTENYTLKLKQSIQDLLSENQKQFPDFSLFIDAFHELMHANVDPPFEVIWVYAAITFRSRKSEKADSLDRVLAAKDLFQLLLSASSGSVDASKSIALLAPLVFELHNVFKELSGSDLRLKREKKAMREVKSLVGVVLSYIGVCCCQISYEDENDSGLNLSLPFNDLACVWVNSNDGFGSLLPLVSRDVCSWLCIAREFDVAYLSGAVIMEVFLLNLCLSLHLEKTPRDDGLDMNLKAWAVGSISTFQNIYFVEILLRAALETPLPMDAILKPEDEILLRKIVFDAVLLVDYPFCYSNTKHFGSLTLTKLVVTHEAVEHFRGLGDQNRAISYTRAFSASNTPSQIIKRVTSLNGLDEKSGRTNGSSPRALISWLLSLENRGISVFVDDILKNHAKSGLGVSQAEQPAGDSEGKIADDDLFYIDNIAEDGEEDKQNERISYAFVAAAQTMKLTEDGNRKRKGISNENSYPVKARTSAAASNSSSGESEVDDPVSDSDA